MLMTSTPGDNYSNITKPACAIGLSFTVFSLASLRAPSFIPLFIALSVVFAISCAFILRRDFAAGIITAVLVVAGAVVPCISYYTNEKPVEEFLNNANGDCLVFRGEVTDVKSSGRFCSFDVKVREIDGKALDKPVNIYTFNFNSDAAQEGDILVFEGTPQSVYQADSDDFDTVSYLRSKRIFAIVKNCRVIQSSRYKDGGMFHKIRQHITLTFLDYLVKDSDLNIFNIARALVTGDDSGLDKEVKSSFKKSGLLHLLCVSGMHLTVISGFAFVILRALTVHKKISALLITGICVFYVLLTGAELSIIRAGIMSCIAYTGSLLGRRSDGAVSLFLSAAAMCAYDPYTALHIGAQLSFAATFGIIAASCLCGNQTKRQKLFSLIVSGISAVCFTLPISGKAFGGISLLSAITTPLASVLCDTSLILLILMIILSPLAFVPAFRIVCSFIGDTVYVMLDSVEKLAHHAASLRFSYVPYSNHADIILCVFCILLILLSLAIFTDLKRAAKAICVCVLILSLWSGAVSLAVSVYEDAKCHVWYYRKNSKDTQVSIKLGNKGAVIINPDSVLCTQSDKVYFDTYSANNIIIIVPDKSLSPEALKANLDVFNYRFGISGVYIANTSGAKELCSQLTACGLDVNILDSTLVCGNTAVSITGIVSGGAKIQVCDGKEDICIVLSDTYDKKDFDGFYGICAYFTSKTKNQFDELIDKKPDGKQFFTRLGKGQRMEGTVNTFGKQCVQIY